MNVLSANFREGTNPWDPQVDGFILPFLLKSIDGSNPDGVMADLSKTQACKAVGGRKIAKPPPATKTLSASHMWDPHKRDERQSAGNMEGVLDCVSATTAMTVMYPGRVARFDLLNTIGFQTKRISRWDRDCDRRLHRLMCYVMTIADEVSYGWIGDDPKGLTAHLLADANFAGCPYMLT